MRRTLVLFLVVGTLAGCSSVTAPAPSSSSAARTSAPAGSDMRVHRDADMGFSIGVLPRWRIRPDATVVTQQGERKGTSFVFPITEAAGTALLSAELHIQVLPGACPRVANGKVVALSSRAYVRTDWSEGAAGSAYEGTSYQLGGPKTCGVATLLIRTCTLGADCGPKHAGPFDASQLRGAAERMLATFTLS